MTQKTTLMPSELAQTPIPVQSSATSSIRRMRSDNDPKDRTPKSWRVNGVFVILTHILSIYALTFTPNRYTLWMTYLTWVLATLGITAGYHRLWSHKSYEASIPLKVILMVCGTLGFQGSIKWWVVRHRLHHRFTETDDDPYSSAKGFWFSHILWIFQKPFYPKMKLIDASDLEKDPVVHFQHKFFTPLSLGICLLLPPLIAHSWGDAIGGFLYGSILARLLIWHATFSINSFAHMLGSRPFSPFISARGGFLLALFTQGEGFHNLHHEFPKDYRNGIGRLDWDPTKWLIWSLSKLGLAKNLYRAPANEIKKAQVDTILHNLNPVYPSPASSLPVMTMALFREMAREKPLLLLNGYIVDTTDFKGHHPGGEEILYRYTGRDASKAFNGGLNMHSRSAIRWMQTLRIAKIEGNEDVASDDHHDHEATRELRVGRNLGKEE